MFWRATMCLLVFVPDEFQPPHATHAGLDGALRELVAGWLAEAWPFDRVSYAGVSGEA